MERVIQTHTMQGQDGETYRVLEIQEYVDASSFDGPAWIEGLKRLELSDGTKINYIDENTFKIVATGEVLSKPGMRY